MENPEGLEDRPGGGARRLLFISDRFPHTGDTISSSFVKGQVDALKDMVEKITVLALTPFVPSVLKHLPGMKPRWRRDPSATDYSYGNVDVRYARHIALPFEAFRRRRGDDALRAALKVMGGDDDFDIIQANFAYPSGYVGARLKERLRLPLVIRCGGYDVYGLPEKSPYWRSRIRGILDCADALIVPSRALAGTVEALGVPGEKVHVIYNGHDPGDFRPMDHQGSRLKLSLPEEKKILLAVGNLEPVKGHAHLLRAMKAVSDARDDVLCLIIGSGSQEKALLEEMGALGLRGSVSLVGERPHQEIPLWMNACDVLVHPSLNEGNPNVMFEALGCGKPFVGTRVGGIPEIIKEDRLGILAEPGDARGLGGAILSALDRRWDPDLISAYARGFSWERTAREMAALYDRLDSSPAHR